MSLSGKETGGKWRVALARLPILATVFIATASSSAFAGSNSALIFDASNSMNSPFDGGSRIEAAKDIIAETVSGFSGKLDLGLVVFGHREAQNCHDVEIKLRSNPGNAARISSAIKPVTAQGVSGLSQSLIEAAQSLDYLERAATIIALADSAGVENCRVDTCATIESLRKESANLVVHLIAVGAKDAEIPHLQCIATTTGGTFSRTKTRTELTASLQRAFALAAEQEQTIEVVLPPRPKPVPRIAHSNLPPGESQGQNNGEPAFAPGEIEAETEADAAAALEVTTPVDPENRVSVFAPTRPGGDAAANGPTAPDADQGEPSENASTFAPSAPAPAPAAPDLTASAETSAGATSAAESSAEENSVALTPSAPTPAAPAPNALTSDASEQITPQPLAAADAVSAGDDTGDDDSPRVLAIADGSEEFSVSLAPQAPAGSTVLVKRRGEGAGARALSTDEQAATGHETGQEGSGVSVRPVTSVAKGRVKLAALIIENTKPVSSGVEWEVLSAGSASTPPRTVARSSEATPEIAVPAGEYLIKGKFGQATRSARVIVRADQTENLEVVLGAGGLQIDPVNAGSENPGDDVLNTIYAAGTTSSPIADKVASGTVIYLNAGVYRIESRYGSANAIARADIEVQPGKLVKAKINHRAGPVSFRLLADQGGEALTGVQWNILSGEGKAVSQSGEATPRIILAEGAYEAVATLKGNTYRSSFEIKPGEETVVEIVSR